jgi:hypothetical protein
MHQSEMTPKHRPTKSMGEGTMPRIPLELINQAQSVRGGQSTARSKQ